MSSEINHGDGRVAILIDVEHHEPAGSTSNLTLWISGLAPRHLTRGRMLQFLKVDRMCKESGIDVYSG